MLNAFMMKCSILKAQKSNTEGKKKRELSGSESHALVDSVSWQCCALSHEECIIAQMVVTFMYR